MAEEGSINTDILSDETFDLLCGVCKGEGINKEAEKFCVDCNSYYCYKCVKIHDHVPALSSHKILDKSHFPSGSVKKQSSSAKSGSKSKIPAPTERCDRHSHHFIDMYCLNHDEVGCGTCFAVDHRSCKDIFYIPEYLQNQSCVETSSDSRKKLESITNTLKSLHQNLKQDKQRYLKNKQELIEKLRKFRKEIDEILDKLEHTTADNIDGKYKALIGEIEENTNLLDSIKAKVMSAQAKVASSGANVSQDFVNAKKGNIIVKDVKASLEKIQSSTDPGSISFVPDQRITTLLSDMSLLGEILNKGSESSGCASDTQGQSGGTTVKDPKINTGQQKQRCIQVRGRRTYSVKVKSDSDDCNIESTCVIDDGTIILLDRNNNKLKQLDSSTYAVIRYCDLNAKPWQVCSTSAHEVAVTLPWNREINFVTVTGSSMSVTNKMNTDFKCYGLAHADGNLYISDSITSVYVYNMSGRKLKQFSKDQSGAPLFSNIYSLTVSVDGSKIYVTDCDKGLIVLDKIGKVVGRFDDPQLKGAYGSYITRNGNLLVCGCHSKNVVQFEENGKLIGEVVNNIGNCKAVCCNHQMSKMLIGQYDDEIEVFDIV